MESLILVRHGNNSSKQPSPPKTIRNHRVECEPSNFYQSWHGKVLVKLLAVAKESQKNDVIYYFPPPLRKEIILIFSTSSQLERPIQLNLQSTNTNTSNERQENKHFWHKVKFEKRLHWKLKSTTTEQCSLLNVTIVRQD